MVQQIDIKTWIDLTGVKTEADFAQSQFKIVYWGR